MTDTLALLVLLFILLAIAFVLPHIIMNRTIPKVIGVLRQHNATSEEQAVFADEIGLAPKPYLQRMIRAKDQKPKALQMLIRLGIVKQNATGKVYLCQEELAKTKWSDL